MSFYKTNGILRIKSDEILVCVKQQKKPENVKDLGIDNIQGFYVGNVVNNNLLTKKLLLPENIRIKDRGILSIDNNTIVGEFILTQIIKSRFKNLQNVIGQSFEGYLLVSKSSVSCDWT